jgi:hypothetical protein
MRRFKIHINNTVPAYLLLFTFTITFLSCASNSSDSPTPKVNKNVFFDFFKFEPTPDVRDFNYYADEIGIDASYWISFGCDDSTIQKIHKSLELHEGKEGRGLFGGLNSSPTKWWDTTFIFKAIPYIKVEEPIYWFLWYDKTKKKAYFLTLDT